MFCHWRDLANSGFCCSWSVYFSFSSNHPWLNRISLHYIFCLIIVSTTSKLWLALNSSWLKATHGLIQCTSASMANSLSLCVFSNSKSYEWGSDWVPSGTSGSQRSRRISVWVQVFTIGHVISLDRQHFQLDEDRDNRDISVAEIYVGLWVEQCFLEKSVNVIKPCFTTSSQELKSTQLKGKATVSISGKCHKIGKV